MTIPIVTFFVFILTSFSYHALKASLPASLLEEAKPFPSIRLLPYAAAFLGLLSSIWLALVLAAPIAQHLSFIRTSFSFLTLELIAAFLLSIGLFGVGYSAGYFLPNRIGNNYPKATLHRFAFLLPESIKEAAHAFADDQGASGFQEKQNEIQNIIEFSGKDVGEIATHRIDLAVLHIDATIEDTFQLIQKVDFTRIPVYEEDIDQIAGMLHVKDFFSLLKSNPSPAFFSLRNLIREPNYVRMNQEIDFIFRDMQKNDYSIAIVLDEFGGTHGLITLEDIIREITRDLLGDQKYSKVEPRGISQLNGNRYLIDGETSLFELEGVLGIQFPTDTYHTLDSFLRAYLPENPEQSESIVYQHLLFRIQLINNHKIESAIVTVYEKNLVEHQFIG